MAFSGFFPKGCMGIKQLKNDVVGLLDYQFFAYWCDYPFSHDEKLTSMVYVHEDQQLLDHILCLALYMYAK